jgi:hypothetical protein
MFSMGHVECIPECDIVMWPGGGVCASNPTSSGEAC